MKLREMNKWHVKRLLMVLLPVVLVGIIFISACSVVLYQDKTSEDQYWEDALTTPADVQASVDELSVNATEVTVGTYVENMKELAIKNSNFRVSFVAWFRWNGNDDLDMASHFRVYKGTMNKLEMIKESHQNGVNYQLVRCDVTVSKDYWTRRFPLESHQLRFYMESTYTVDKVVFVADKENSGSNPSLSISGYDLVRHDVGTFANEYPSTQNDPELNRAPITSEFVTAMEINRNSIGLYFKCFVALIGTLTWVLIALFICTYHRVDPLGMIPAALFGTVTNIMVGANLLPDALQLGLLEFTNTWGIFTIITVTISIININRIRNSHEDKEFARLFGQIMFWTILVLTLAGHAILPIMAYMM